MVEMTVKIILMKMIVNMNSNVFTHTFNVITSQECIF